MKNCVLLLTCANDEEANKISQVLLEKKLVACVKKTSVSSSFLWKGKIDKSDEVLIIMDSVEEKFEKIETEVKKIHSYETFVLTALPISKITKDASDWISKELI